MKPKQILADLIDRFLVEAISALGFKYSPSQLKFSRRDDPFTQIITFTVSHYSTVQGVIFWTSWGVGSKQFTRWYKDQWGKKTQLAYLAVSNDWLIPGWSVQSPNRRSIQPDLSGKKIMRSLLTDFTGPGFQFLERISDWKGAAEQRMELAMYPTIACDLLMVAGDEEAALKLVRSEIERLSREGVKDQFIQLPELRARLEKYFS
jgi:hypothetical protein